MIAVIYLCVVQEGIYGCIPPMGMAWNVLYRGHTTCADVRRLDCEMEEKDWRGEDVKMDRRA